MNNRDKMRSRRTLLSAISTGFTAMIAGCSSSETDQQESGTVEDSNTPTTTATTTPTGPDSGLFGTTTFAFPRRHGRSQLGLSGRYAPEFEAPDEIEEFRSFTLTAPDISNSTANDDAFVGGLYFDNGTGFLADENVRRVAYDGTVEWESGSGNTINDGVAVGDDTVIISTDGRLVGYDRESGEEQWVREGGLPLLAGDGYLYQLSGGTITKSELESGSDVWEVTPTEPSDSDYNQDYGIPEDDVRRFRHIRFTDEYIVLQLVAERYSAASISRDHLSAWLAINRESGEREWISTGHANRDIDALLVEESLVTFSEETFRAFSLETGDNTMEIEHDYSLPEYPVHPPGFITSNGNLLFTRSEDGIVAHNLDDGEQEWETLMPSSPSQAIACADETVYSVVNGQIRKLNASSGEEVGRFETEVGDINGLNLVGDHLVTFDHPFGFGDEFDVALYAAPQ